MTSTIYVVSSDLSKHKVETIHALFGVVSFTMKTLKLVLILRFSIHAFVQQIFVYVCNCVKHCCGYSDTQTKMIQKVASIFTFYIWTSG